jgi:hypothetical protein
MMATAATNRYWFFYADTRARGVISVLLSSSRCTADRDRLDVYRIESEIANREDAAPARLVY